MHLVFLNQYYPPDVAPTGVMLAAVAEELAAQGHKVTVICSKGGYTGMIQKTARHETRESTEVSPTIIRIRAMRFVRSSFLGKVLDYLFYYLGATLRLAVMHPRPDRIIALTTPPYLSVLARLISRLRGADHAHWVMDLYPDVMVAHGMLRDGSVAHQALAWLSRWGFGGKRCAALLTIGPDMAERIKNLNLGNQDPENSSTQRSGSGESIASWIPLWSGAEQEADDLTDIKRRSEMGWRDNQLVVMYSGNMGLGHRFEEILEFIGKQNTRLDQDAPATRFVFFGGGKRRAEIAKYIDQHPDACMELHDYAPAEILTTHLRSADVHIASLDAKWTASILPSKLQGIFAAGRPVIFIGDAISSIGRWVTQSTGGWVVAPGDVRALETAIIEVNNSEIRTARGRAAKEFAELFFNRQINVKQVSGILASNKDY